MLLLPSQRQARGNSKLTENGYVGRIHIMLHVDHAAIDHSSSPLMPHAE